MHLLPLSSVLLKSKHNQYTRPVLRLTIAGVALGMAIMIITIAVTVGYKNVISEKIVAMGAHIRIANYDQNHSFEPIPFDKNESTLKNLFTAETQSFFAIDAKRKYCNTISCVLCENPLCSLWLSVMAFRSGLKNPFFIEEISKNPHIKNIHFFSTKTAILKTSDQVEGAILKGVDHTFPWSLFDKNMIDGNHLNLSTKEPCNEIVISFNIAQKLKLKTGDKVAAYFVQDPPRQRNFTVCGIYKTDMPDFDNKFGIIDLRQIQKLNNWDSTLVGGIEILIDNFDHLDQIGYDIHQNIGYQFKAETIKQLYPHIFEWVALFDTNAAVLLIITIFVCIITIISTFFIIVLEQTGTIGILKTIGMQNQQLFRLFLLIGIRLLGKGLCWGNGIALLICLIQKQFHLIPLNPQTYYVGYIPISLNISWILAINLGVMLICLITLVIPALFISKKISPINAIRFD